MASKMSRKSVHDKTAKVQRNDWYSSKQARVREIHLIKQTLQSLQGREIYIKYHLPK